VTVRATSVSWSSAAAGSSDDATEDGIAPPTMAARESMASFAMWMGCGGPSVGIIGGCDCGGLAVQEEEERVPPRGLNDDTEKCEE
jgi:hypothetical protein